MHNRFRITISIHLFLISCLCVSEAETIDFEANRAIERELLPYFTAMLQSRDQLSKTKSFHHPTQQQLLSVARSWNHLSHTFKTTLLQAVAIPPESDMYKTPGFGIEIYYTTAGTDAVDSTDTYGYQEDDWRLLVPGPNGIPDYVDETGWALDSSWNMMINQIGFHAPSPIGSDSFLSDNYKVRIGSVGNFYGITYPAGPVEGETGFRSLVVIRNRWTGWNLSAMHNYETDPLKGISITCAHELFHAIQYATAHQEHGIAIDYFPISFLEATAVLMEELVFDYVNDFVQYTNAFFGDPGNYSFFSHDTRYDLYASSILPIFICYKLGKQIGPQFIKNIFDLNNSVPQKLDHLLDSASQKAGMTWGELLHQFFVSSYFTGRRENGLFTIDASQLPEWDYTAGSVTVGMTETKRILPYGMQPFSCILSSDTNNRILRITCAVDGMPPPVLPDMSVILKRGSGDTIIVGNLTNETIQVTIENSHMFSEALIIVSNGNYDRSIFVTISVHGSTDLIINKKNAPLSVAIKEPPISELFNLNGTRINKKTNTSAFYIRRVSHYLYPHGEKTEKNTVLRSGTLYRY